METLMCNGDSIIKLPAGLPAFTTPDGKVCYVDSNTVWIPTGSRPGASSIYSPCQELTEEPLRHDMSEQSANMSDSQSSYQIHYSSYADIESTTFGGGNTSSMMTSSLDTSEMSSLQQSSLEQDLTEINPEYFICGIPGIDEPLSTSTPVHTFPNMTWTDNSVSILKDVSPCVKTTSGHRRNITTSVSENRSLYEPQPIRAKFSAGKSCVRRLFSDSTEDEDSTFSSKGLTSLSSLQDSTLEDGLVTSSRQCSLQLSSLSGGVRSCKRKLQSDDTDAIRRGKLARVNANDVITEMELLRAVESLSHAVWWIGDHEGRFGYEGEKTLRQSSRTSSPMHQFIQCTSSSPALLGIGTTVGLKNAGLEGVFSKEYTI